MAPTRAAGRTVHLHASDCRTTRGTCRSARMPVTLDELLPWLAPLDPRPRGRVNSEDGTSRSRTAVPAGARVGDCVSTRSTLAGARAASSSRPRATRRASTARTASWRRRSRPAVVAAIVIASAPPPSRARRAWRGAARTITARSCASAGSGAVTRAPGRARGARQPGWQLSGRDDATARGVWKPATCSLSQHLLAAAVRSHSSKEHHRRCAESLHELVAEVADG